MVQANGTPRISKNGKATKRKTPRESRPAPAAPAPASSVNLPLLKRLLAQYVRETMPDLAREYPDAICVGCMAMDDELGAGESANVVTRADGWAGESATLTAAAEATMGRHCWRWLELAAAASQLMDDVIATPHHVDDHREHGEVIESLGGAVSSLWTLAEWTHRRQNDEFQPVTVEKVE